MTGDRAREEIAAALPESLGPVGLRHRSVPALGVEGSVTGYGEILLDALMPVLDRLAEERGRQMAADELRAAAQAWADSSPWGTRERFVYLNDDASDFLHRRADALSEPVTAEHPAAGRRLPPDAADTAERR